MFSYYLMTVLIYSSFASVNCFIIRIKDCRYSANFSDIRENEYFELYDASVKATVETILNVNRSECSLYCLSRDSCVRANHKMDDTSCELLPSSVGKHISKTGWRAISTRYTNDDFRYRGPMCRFIKPTMEDVQICRDKCEAPGYKIVGNKNFAKNQPTMASSTISGQHHREAVDGNGQTYWRTKAEKKTWLRVDLGNNYMVNMIYLNLQSANINNFGVVTLKIGLTKDATAAEICKDNIDMSVGGKKRKIYCPSPITGRYVFFERTSSADKVCTINEFSVYAIA